MRERTRLIVTIAGIVVALLALYFFMIRPARSTLAETAQRADAAEAQTQALRVELERRQALQANEAQLEAELAEMRGFVPRRHEIPNFILQMQDEANAAGVDFLDITPELPAPPPEGAALGQVQMDIRASGGYFSIQDFIRRIYNFDRALRIDVASLNIVGEEGEEDPDLDLVMTARIFFEAPGTVAPAAPPPPEDEGTPEGEDEEGTDG